VRKYSYHFCGPVPFEVDVCCRLVVAQRTAKPAGRAIGEGSISNPSIMDLTLLGDLDDYSSDEDTVRGGGGDDDGGSASRPRQLLLRANRSFEADLAALRAAVTVPQTSVAAEAPAEIIKLTFDGHGDGRVLSAIEHNSYRISSGHFVDILVQTTTQQPQRLGRGVTIRTFKFHESCIGSHHEYYREEDLERLVRDVLPNHPTIERIRPPREIREPVGVVGAPGARNSDSGASLR
jgi:hypothetical protein